MCTLCMFWIFLVLVGLYTYLFKLYMDWPPVDYADGQEIIYCTIICLPYYCRELTT